MRKILFTALVALCLTVQGPVSAKTIAPPITEQPQSDLVEELIKRASVETGIPVAELNCLYDCGNVTISKTSEGYEISILTEGGGLLTVIVEDSF